MQPLRARLHHLAIAAADPDALMSAYARMLGMSAMPGDPRAAIGRARRLLFVPGEPRTLGFAAFAVADESEIATLRARCGALGVAVRSHVDPFFRQGAISVTDPDGNVIAFGIAEDDDAPAGEGALPARLQHVVVASPDAARISAFYQSAFGFEVSDNVYDEEGQLRTAFLRCSEEHHSFAVFQAARKWFDHHCYETADWNGIRDWGDHFAAERIPVQWGPGRHGPGNNLFLFVHDPEGNWVEISAELEHLPEGREPGVWKHEQRTLNSWGSAPLRS